MIIVLLCLLPIAFSFQFDIEVERQPENKRPINLLHPEWLHLNPSDPSLRTFDQGKLTQSGLTLRNTKTGTSATCKVLNKNTELKSNVEKLQTKYASKQIVCDEPSNSLRFKEEPSLKDHLQTPHGMVGGWLPYQQNQMQLVPFATPVASYMMAYSGMYGCLVLVTGPSTSCPPHQLVGPFMIQNAIGSSFFLPPKDMPFVPNTVGGGD